MCISRIAYWIVSIVAASWVLGVSKQVIGHSLSDGRPISVAPAGEAQSAPDEYHKVQIPGCPTSIEIKVPDGFTLPSDAGQRRKKAQILDALHSNSARKARYSELFLKDWTAELNYPHVMIGTLGTVLKAQGHIGPEDWAGIKSEFMKLHANSALREQTLESKVKEYQAGSRAGYEMQHREIVDMFEEDENSLVMLATVRAQVNQTTLNLFSASKFVYVPRCLVQVIIAVSADDPSAPEDIATYVVSTQVQ